jgi:hypothetical protein
MKTVGLLIEIYLDHRVLKNPKHSKIKKQQVWKLVAAFHQLVQTTELVKWWW